MLRRFSFRGAVTVLCFSVSLFAQRTPPGGGTPSTPSPTAPGSIPGGTRSPGTTQSPFPTTQPNQVNRPIWLSGKVMLDDGTPAPPNTAIQRVCASGVPRTESYTDSKGHFSFQMGQELGVLPDASEDNMSRPGMPPGASNSGMGSMGSMGRSGLGQNSMMMTCELRASLAGYRSDTVNLAMHQSLDNPDVGTILLHRLGNVQGLTISATSMSAPKDAKKAYEKGLNALKKQKLDDAENEFQKAVDIYPKYAVAWYELGRVQERQKKMDEARKSYQQALAADSKYVSPYEGLAEIAVHEQKWQDAKESTSRLLGLNPVDFPQAWFYNAVANYEMKDYAEAEKSAREGLKADSDHMVPRMNQLLAVLLAGKQDYAGAAQYLREYLKIAPNGPEAETVKKQLATVEQQIEAKAPKQPEPPPQP